MGDETFWPQPLSEQRQVRDAEWERSMRFRELMDKYRERIPEPPKTEPHLRLIQGGKR